MHKIVALWSHPRSMSTAMERIMRERGDFTCFHEPFMYDYYVNRKVREMPHFDIEVDRPKTYDDIRDMLLKSAEDKPVFFKDMSYYVLPHILDDKSLVERISHCFLIRNPLESILSYYKLDPEVLLEEIGLEAQWKHYNGLINSGFNPVIVEAEKIRNNAKSVISQLWKTIGIPYEEKGFEWQNEQPEDWDQVSGWHGKVTKSKGIQKLSVEQQDQKKQQFYEFVKKAPKLQDYLNHHKPFYEQLRKNAMKT